MAKGPKRDINMCCDRNLTGMLCQKANENGDEHRKKAPKGHKRGDMK